MKFSFTDYFTHPQNVETFNRFVDMVLLQQKRGISLLDAVKKYYEELKQTHFFFYPYFDYFLDYVIDHQKLLRDYAEKLKQKNLK